MTFLSHAARLTVLLFLPAVGMFPQTANAAKYASLTAGRDHTCVLQDQLVSDHWIRTPVCWGANGSGQLGNPVGDPAHEYSQATPVRVLGLSGYVTQLSAGGSFTCALNSQGAVQCWGSSFQGELGTEYWNFSNPWPNSNDSVTPIMVPAFGSQLPISQISAGASHVCALSSAGAVYCWGDNRNYELGTTAQWQWGYTINPQLIQLPYPALSISSGEDFTCALLKGPFFFGINWPGVWCWGADGHGQLGDGGTPGFPPLLGKAVPVRVTGLNLWPVAISAADEGACALDSAGNEQCWGDAMSGEIGNGVNYPNGIATPASVAGGPFNVMATGAYRLMNCGASGPSAGLWCWGTNYWAELTLACPGSSCNVPVQTQVFNANVPWPNVPPSAPTAISAGLDHVCAIAALSNIPHVYCWGHNDYGQVGNGDTTFSYWNSAVTAPTPIL